MEEFIFPIIMFGGVFFFIFYRIFFNEERRVKRKLKKHPINEFLISLMRR